MALSTSGMSRALRKLGICHSQRYMNHQHLLTPGRHVTPVITIIYYDNHLLSNISSLYYNALITIYTSCNYHKPKPKYTIQTLNPTFHAVQHQGEQKQQSSHHYSRSGVLNPHSHHHCSASGPRLRNSTPCCWSKRLTNTHQQQDANSRSTHLNCCRVRDTDAK